MITLRTILENYTKCPSYDKSRAERAIGGDAIELANIGTDFAKNQMYEKAVTCWEHIIESDLPVDSSVYCNLGVCYFYGNGVSIDKKAAAMGHPFGQYNLAVALEQGKGVEKNPSKAIHFYSMAAHNHVNQAIDALIRLGEYDELKLAYYSRNHIDDSF